jgi:hypothetical protein
MLTLTRLEDKDRTVVKAKRWESPVCTRFSSSNEFEGDNTLEVLGPIDGVRSHWRPLSKYSEIFWFQLL